MTLIRKKQFFIGFPFAFFNLGLVYSNRFVRRKCEEKEENPLYFVIIQENSPFRDLGHNMACYLCRNSQNEIVKDLKNSNENINYEFVGACFCVQHNLMLKNNNITQGGVE